jgi:glutamate N-acetyltransferase/amino-acid N-acetyltransferase
MGLAMDLTASPLALPFPEMPQIAGVTARIARAGYKDWGRCDLTYVELAEGTSVAGLFTKNVCCSTEVELGREQVKAGRARALVVNAGNANAWRSSRSWARWPNTSAACHRRYSSARPA